MPATYDCISTTTLGSNNAVISLSGISSNYTDLLAVFTFGVSAGADIFIQFNDDTNANYSVVRFWGFAGSIQSTRESSQSGIRPRTISNQSTTVNSTYFVNVMNYASTNMNKMAISRYNPNAPYPEADVGLWRNNSAITKITFTTVGAPVFVAGTTVSLYGIKAA